MSDMHINEKVVDFIADWRKRAAQQQRKYTTLSVAVLAAAFLFCVFAFFFYQQANYSRVVEQNMKYIQDSATQEANQMERELKHARNAVVTLASRYVTLRDYKVGSTMEEMLTILQDKSVFDRIAHIAPDGSDTSLEGLADVSDRNYFQAAMRGESGWEMLDSSRVTGKPAVVFYAPIRDDTGIAGVMAGFFEQSRLNSLFSFQFFNYTPVSYLLQGDGDVIASTEGNVDGKNMLNELSQKKFLGGTAFSDVEDAIADTRRTSIAFGLENGNRTSVGVIIQFSSSDWMILSVFPEEVTTGMVQKANRDGMRLLFSVAAASLAVIFALVFFLRRQRRRLEKEMDLAASNLELSQTTDRRQLAIIRALASIFSSVYYVDLEKSEYTRITEQTGNVNDIPDVGNAEEGFSYYVEHYVDEEHLPEMRQFLDAGSFGARVETGGMLATEYRRSDGGWRRGSLIPAETGGDGHLTSIVFGVQRIDLAKQKEQETKEALQEAYHAAQLANHAKTTFLSNMSHDIRTPMNAIIGMTTIAAAHLNEPDKISECLKKITSSSRHLLALINEVLDMSKIESGKVDLSEEAFSLSGLMDNLISIHQPLIRERGHTLTVRVRNLEHEQVIGDSTRLQQVFANLLSNAIKYTPNGGELEISISEKDTNKPNFGWYEVVFKDNGIGMSEDYQRTIFEPFTRAEDHRVSKIQGTGLGMPIAKNIIQMMGGNITVESQINQGSTFTVTFALKLQSEDEVDRSRFVDLPVLVVDDDVIACESICATLDELDMNSEWVTSGREAVDRAVCHHRDENDYYAVIVDWKMPGMDGLETARELRRELGEGVPIIVISAYDWSDIEAEARDAGVNAFLGKPVFRSRVVALFNELLDAGHEAELPPPAAASQSFDFTSRRILLVEDNELNREVAVELLQMAGFQMETAEDGKVGLDTFSASAPGYYDLILMDVQMPVMDGYAATRAIRALERPDAGSIPILAMSANAFAADVQDALNAGMNGHVAKPVDLNRLLTVLREFLPPRRG